MDKLEFLIVIIDAEKTAKLVQRLTDCGVNFIHVVNARNGAVGSARSFRRRRNG